MVSLKSGLLEKLGAGLTLRAGYFATGRSGRCHRHEARPAGGGRWWERYAI
jgi:hypothetical protein